MVLLIGDMVLAFFLGLGIGAYKKDDIGPCLEDTFHLTKQKGGPAMQKVKEQSVRAANSAKEQSMPYLQKMKDQMGRPAQ